RRGHRVRGPGGRDPARRCGQGGGEHRGGAPARPPRRDRGARGIASGGARDRREAARPRRVRSRRRGRADRDRTRRDRVGAARRARASDSGGSVIDRVAFDERGLVPAIVQDAATGAVLMLAYMDREAFTATLRTREIHFHSRSRGRLWKKGETSGNVLHLVDLALDCDADALLVKAHPAGPTCHTGAATCFSPINDTDLGRFLTELAATLIERKRDLPAGSYSAELFRGGTEAIAAKLVEEATETAAALRGEGRARTISELTDLLYVMLVLATDIGASPDEIRTSLEAKRAAAPARRAQREGR